MPDQFWSLTYREFGLKFDAFARAEDRQRALVFELALMTAKHDSKWESQTKRSINQLRRYPLKRWLLAAPPPR